MDWWTKRLIRKLKEIGFEQDSSSENAFIRLTYQENCDINVTIPKGVATSDRADFLSALQFSVTEFESSELLTLQLDKLGKKLLAPDDEDTIEELDDKLYSAMISNANKLQVARLALALGAKGASSSHAVQAVARTEKDIKIRNRKHRILDSCAEIVATCFKIAFDAHCHEQGHFRVETNSGRFRNETTKAVGSFDKFSRSHKEKFGFELHRATHDEGILDKLDGVMAGKLGNIFSKHDLPRAFSVYLANITLNGLEFYRDSEAIQMFCLCEGIINTPISNLKSLHIDLTSHLKSIEQNL